VSLSTRPHRFSAVEHLIPVIDLLLIMTVNPGFGGQGYITAMDPKISAAKKMIARSGRPIDLEVDGGVKASNARHVADLGANMLVMGTEIFHSGDYQKKFAEIRERLKGVGSRSRVKSKSLLRVEMLQV